MISANDTTILAVLSRFPDMSATEADEYIGKIQHEENVPICHAVLGRISPDELEGDARQTYEEFQRWSADRTRRVRNEEIDARRRRKETRLSLNMTRLHEQGLVSDQVMMLYGISGDLPERSNYFGLTDEEKERLWVERMERRFGPNWLDRFPSFRTSRPFFNRRGEYEAPLTNWRLEGF